ncbi:MAG: SPFH domain-containing protein, partial [Promethearchaeota archaeon]
MVVISAPTMAYTKWLGKPYRLLVPGFYFLAWPLECLHKYYWKRTDEDPDGSIRRRTYSDFSISTSEMIYDPPPYRVVTKDRLTVDINIVIHFKIHDVKAAFFNIQDLYGSMESRLETAIIHRASQMSLENAIDGRHTFHEYIINEFLDCSEHWGIEITRLDIQNVTPSDDIIKATQSIVAKQRQETANLKRNQALHRGTMDRLKREREQLIVALDTASEERETKRATEAAFELAQEAHQARLLMEEQQAREEREYQAAEKVERLNLLRANKEKERVEIENECLFARVKMESEATRLRNEANATAYGSQIRAIFDAGLDKEAFCQYTKWKELGSMAANGSIQFLPQRAVDLMGT